MTLEIEPKVLGAIHSALKSIPDRTLKIPVAAMFRFAASDGRLTVTASDFDLEATIGVDMDAAFDPICLPPYLVEAGGGLAKKVKVEIGEREAVVSAGRSRFRGPVMPGKDFPLMAPTFDGGGEVEGTALARILDATAGAAAVEDHRFYLEGVFLEGADGRLIATATDGHRLHSASADAGGFRLAEGVIIPTKAVKEIVRVAGKAASDMVRVETCRTAIAVTAGDERLVSKLIDHTYPDWRRVAPDPTGVSATLDLGEMLAALDRVTKIQAESAIKAKDKKAAAAGSGIKLTADGGWLTVNGVGNFTEGDDAVGAEFAGAWGHHGVSGKYLRATLAAMKDRGTETIVIDSDEPGAPLRIESTTDENFLAIVMPMRV